MAPLPIETAGPALPSGRFIAVPEEELGKAEEDAPRTSIFSWRTSWQTWALAAALLLMGWSLKWFLQPPSADFLFQKISEKMTDEQSDLQFLKMSDVVESRARRFLEPLSNDPDAGRSVRVSKKLSLRKLEFESSLLVRGEPARGSIPLAQLYFEAMIYAQTDPTRAIAKLQAILDLHHQPADDSGQTGQCLALGVSNSPNFPRKSKK